MMKLLLILLGIIVAVFLFIGWILKKVRNMFMPFQQGGNTNKQKAEQRPRSDGNVIYKKDDVVVMKGDAGKKNN